MSESDSDDDRMFDPDLVYSSDEDNVMETEDALEYWNTNKNAHVIREIFENSIESLNRNMSSDSKWDGIRIVTDKNKRTLSIIDNGVGMTKDELECYGSSSGRARDLLLVADKVVVTTKHEGEEEYVMELSCDEEDEKIVVATQNDADLLFRGTRRGTKITLFLKQDDGVERLLKFATFLVLGEEYFSNVSYNFYFISNEAGIVSVMGFMPDRGGVCLSAHILAMNHLTSSTSHDPNVCFVFSNLFDGVCFLWFLIPVMGFLIPVMEFLINK